MRLALILLLVGCVTNPDDDHEGPPLISKVAYKDFPVAAGQLLSLASPCWEVTLAKPYECSVQMLSDDGVTAIMPSCALFPDARPCWAITIDPQNCFDAAQQKLEVLRREPARYDHHLVAHCVAY